MNEIEAWHVVRIRQQHGHRIDDKLTELDIEHYIPFRNEWSEVNGKRVKQERIATLNLIFVRTTEQDLRELYMKMDGMSFVPMYDVLSKHPLVVPDRQMHDFKFLMDFSSDAVEILNENLKRGDRVRVIKGDFAGIEGELIRVKGHKRVVVRLEGIISLATTYLPPNFLEKLD